MRHAPTTGDGGHYTPRAAPYLRGRHASHPPAQTRESPIPKGRPAAPEVSGGARRARRIRVLLVSDVRAYRDALARWCDRQGGVRVVATVGHHDGALALAREHQPDIALLDMRGPDSRELARALARQSPEVKLVGLGLSETEDNVLAYAGAGFAGYVPREAPLEDVVSVLRGIARGEVRYSRRIAATLLHRLANGSAAHGGRPAQLTPREIEIVRLIDEGLSNRDIGHRLAIEVATVKNHVHHVLEKLQVHRRGEAAARLRRQPLPALNPRI